MSPKFLRNSLTIMSFCAILNASMFMANILYFPAGIGKIGMLVFNAFCFGWCMLIANQTYKKL